MARVPNCSTCGKAVGNDDRALLCDLCETWEHQCCVHEKERLTEELYASISACSSKSIMYVCTSCRNEGSLSKRLMKCELECARMNEQRLASERLLEERQCRIKNLLVDKEELVKEKNQLLVQLSGKTEMMPFMDKAHHVPSIESVTGSSDAITMSPLLSDDLSSETSDEEENRSSRREVNNRASSGHPPGLKTYEHELEGSVERQVERISVFGCQITRRPLLIFAGMMKNVQSGFPGF